MNKVLGNIDLKIKILLKLQNYMVLFLFIFFTASSAQANALDKISLFSNGNPSQLADGLKEKHRVIDNSFQKHLSKEERDYLLKKKQLNLCVDPDWMPYEKIENGEHLGMSSEVIKLIAQQLNIPIILIPTQTWTESLELGKQRHCDFFSLIMRTPQREKFLDFSDAYFRFPLVIATRYEQSFIDDIESVLDKKLGIQKGYAYAELLRLQYPSIILIEVDGLKDGFQKVIDNELFGMIGTLPSIAYTLQNNSISGLMISGRLTQVWHLGLGARNDEPQLISVLNKAVAQLDKDKLEKITNQWMTIKYYTEPPYAMLIKGLGLVTMLFAFFLYHHLQLKKYNKHLQQLSVTDALTKINNRIALDQQLDSSINMIERYQQKFSVILLDIDFFKRINDGFGHLVGDYAIKTVAQLLKDNVRSVDTLGRWGGEEFLIICPDQTVDGASLLAEKLRKAIDSYHFEHFSNLSCSFGVSAYTKDDSSDELITRADIALYKAKGMGRNKVCMG